VARERTAQVSAAIAAAALGVVWLLRGKRNSWDRTAATLDRAARLDSPASPLIERELLIEQAETDQVTDPKQLPSRRAVMRFVPPLWAVLLVVSCALTVAGFNLLPSVGTRLAQPPIQVLNIQVDRPGIHLMAVLDAQLAMGLGFQAAPKGLLTLDLYANSQPGGFLWRVQASRAASIQEPRGRWTNQVTGPAVGRRDTYTLLAHAADLRSTLLTGNMLPTAILFVRLDSADFTVSGSHVQAELPAVVLNDGPTPPVRHQGEKWYAPTGQVVIIAPDELQNYQTDVVTPAFAAPELWRSSDFIFPYWLGTDPLQESADNQALFIAGLLFGLAGAGVIGFAQDVTSRYRSWRELQTRKERNSADEAIAKRRRRDV